VLLILLGYLSSLIKVTWTITFNRLIFNSQFTVNMDFLKAGVRLSHLLKDEITHELSIRKLAVNPVSRRNSLQQVLKQTADLARRGSIKCDLLEEVDLTTELATLRRKIEDIEGSLSDELSSTAVDRLTSRCNYLICRLSRLPSDAEDVRLLTDTLRVMLNRLGNSNSDSASSDSDEGDSPDDKTPVIREIIYKTEKCFNINSLNLKYKGDTCVRVFLTRLEELRVARRIPEKQIYHGFPEILDGPALAWFRSNRDKLLTYQDVIRSLKDDFDIPDLDYKLLQEIRARTQAKEETIVFFVSTVLGMFARLSHEVSEEEKLDILLRNVRPDYSKELALYDITSIQQLKTYCKRLELAKVKAENFCEPSSSHIKKNSSGAFPPPKLNVRNNYNSKQTYPNTKSFAFSVGQSTSRSQCFRCGLTNHSTNVCRKSRDIVCFKCGEKGVRTPDCPKCTRDPKN
jgi:hypothetical protein